MLLGAVPFGVASGYVVRVFTLHGAGLRGMAPLPLVTEQRTVISRRPASACRSCRLAQPATRDDMPVHARVHVRVGMHMHVRMHVHVRMDMHMLMAMHARIHTLAYACACDCGYACVCLFPVHEQGLRTCQTEQRYSEAFQHGIPPGC